jgi:hypothetical protein
MNSINNIEDSKITRQKYDDDTEEDRKIDAIILKQKCICEISSLARVTINRYICLKCYLYKRL